MPNIKEGIKMAKDEAVRQVKKMAKEAIKKAVLAILKVAGPYIAIALAVIIIVVVIATAISDNDTSAAENDASGYTEVSNGTSIGAEFLMSWENATVRQYIKGNISYSDHLSKYITEDKQYYVCYTDYEEDRGDRNFAYGVCHTPDKGATYYHTTEYSNAGIDITSGNYNEVGVSQISVPIVDQVFTEMYNKYKQEVINAFGNTDIEETKIDALTCVKYQYGNIGNAVELYNSGSDFVSNFQVSDGSGGYYAPLNANGRYKGNESRVNANYKLFSEGTYTTGYGTTLKPEDYGNGNENESLVETAKRIHNYIKEKDYAYSCVHNVNNNYSNGCTCDGTSNFGKGLSDELYNIRCIDCSAYVSWVLYEYLGSENFGSKWTSLNFASNYSSKGWQRIEMKDIQAGDILYTSKPYNHVGIYIGDGKTVEAGCTNSIRTEYSYGSIQSVTNAYEFAIRIK